MLFRSLSPRCVCDRLGRHNPLAQTQRSQSPHPIIRFSKEVGRRDGERVRVRERERERDQEGEREKEGERKRESRESLFESLNGGELIRMKKKKRERFSPLRLRILHN